ncbi:DUF6932 family protein [Actinomadura adrarensis]|uniref:DUF6932 family protein n=1 Tax=Actinomadura adrarensis TaxID=1819600 RepID=A0ABW3CQC7_9ACTN
MLKRRVAVWPVAVGYRTARTETAIMRCMARPSLPPPLVDGQLPHGRWVCTEEEVKAAYIDGQAGDREEIWREWREVTGVLRNIVGEVAACWLSGSLFTDKPDPADVDCVYIIDVERLLTAANSDARHDAFLRYVARSQLKDVYDVRVDSYILEWTPTPGPAISDVARGYLRRRGYWDDLWCRVRDEDPRLDSIPRRGYLEVQLDGYK